MKNTTLINIDYSQLQAGKNEITFQSEGYNLSGFIFLPDNFDAEQKYPSVIIDIANTQVKEQAGAIYGAKLARKGYVSFVFDHRGFGSSEGEIKNWEYTPYTFSAIRDAISFFRMHQFVDRNNFFGFGICAGATRLGYTAVTDKRIKALATVVGWFDMENTFFGQAGPNGEHKLVAMLDGVSEAIQKQYETGEYATINKMNQYKPITEASPELIRHSYDYYEVRSKHTPYSPIQPSFNLPVDPIYNFSKIVNRLYMPLLVVSGSRAFSLPMTEAVYEAASEPKEKLIIEGPAHHDLYDIDKYVDQAIDKVDEFFKRYSR
ncbi:MAG: alpha/beta hydrolase [Chitinophagales bacterium]|nr:alpha/beta hydrolase [Chitinophagales bacterium]